MELQAVRGWKEVLKPYLEAKRDQSFPDPTDFKDEKKFLYAALNASIFKKVIAEMLKHLEYDIPLAVKQLKMKEKGIKDTKFQIGR
jgi:hypothetical protein